MAKARKDLKGRALWKGECQRASDKKYVYTYTDAYGKRRSVYANDLAELRKKEQELMKDQFDGIDSAKARNITLNKVFESYIATKYDLRPNTLHTYKYLYWHYVGGVMGKKKLIDLRYADMVHFYFYLIEEKQLRGCNKEEEQKAQEENREPIIIPHFSCHVFRHTFCTRFCENETNIKVIQEIMGHANLTTNFIKTVLNRTE